MILIIQNNIIYASSPQKIKLIDRPVTEISIYHSSQNYRNYSILSPRETFILNNSSVMGILILSGYTPSSETRNQTL